MDHGRLAHAYGFQEPLVVTAGPRGALGQIWRLDVGTRAYALKEIWFEPPSTARIAAELEFAGRAARAGVRLPASHPDRDGRYLQRTHDGAWLRLYDWVDLRPVELAAPATPRRVGQLLARLHRCGTAMATEGSPDPWYERIPDRPQWTEVLAADAPWVPRLAEVLASVPELCAAMASTDPAGLVVGHRDLHPDNVLLGSDDELVVVDWDNFGPVDPAREVAQALFDWYGGSPASMRQLYQAYIDEGGPGRITGPADFSMLLATSLNFLLVQARAAIDPDVEPRHRDWAEREINDSLHRLPSVTDLAAALAAIR